MNMVAKHNTKKHEARWLRWIFGSFITLKDHKEKFRASRPCNLIDPLKIELGKVSKVISEKVNKNFEKSLNINQWNKTDSVIN